MSDFTAGRTSFVGLTACSTEVSQLEDENKKLTSRIELLERKIRVKDQLFDDSLATVLSCNKAEPHNLITKLKKRVV
jgi:hypothetical protein